MPKRTSILELIKIKPRRSTLVNHLWRQKPPARTSLACVNKSKRSLMRLQSQVRFLLVASARNNRKRSIVDAISIHLETRNTTKGYQVKHHPKNQVKVLGVTPISLINNLSLRLKRLFIEKNLGNAEMKTLSWTMIMMLTGVTSAKYNWLSGVSFKHPQMTAVAKVLKIKMMSCKQQQMITRGKSLHIQ